MFGMTAQEIIDANRFMTLATAGADGRPWASPVWYAPDGGTFLWVSKPAARHSRNLAERPDVGIVIFDSSRRPGDTSALYLEAVAEEIAPQAIEVFSRYGVAQELPPWTEADVTAPARHRLYRATVSQAYVLDDHDERIPVAL